MKKVLMLVVLLSLSNAAYANCGNDNGNGNGCSGNIGPQGPTGPQGPAGLNGSNGLNGANGANGSNGADGLNGANGKDGKDGRNGTDAQVNRSAKLVLDTAIRIYDGKRFQLQAFNVYQPSRVNNQDVIGDGCNLMFGMRIVFKLGSSYEERLLEKQAHDIKALEATLSRMQ